VLASSSPGFNIDRKLSIYALITHITKLGMATTVSRTTPVPHNAILANNKTTDVMTTINGRVINLFIPTPLALNIMISNK
jgi:hypothetical protein